MIEPTEKPPKKRIHSKRKGKVQELSLAKYLRGWQLATGEPVEARRGQQFKGSGDSPDIVHNLPKLHIECKSSPQVSHGTQKLLKALKQARNEAPVGHLPVVFFRHLRSWQVAVECYSWEPFELAVWVKERDCSVDGALIAYFSADDFMGLMGCSQFLGVSTETT